MTGQDASRMDTARSVLHQGEEAVTFREMKLEDIPQIIEVEHESFTVPWTAEAFRNELMHNQYAHYIVMEQEDLIIGYAGMWLIFDEAHITNIAVREKYRGKKLGYRLLRELVRAARTLGADKMTLEVRVSNQVAQNLYAKFGFRPVGLRKGYYSDNHEDALIMWAEVRDQE